MEHTHSPLDIDTAVRQYTGGSNFIGSLQRQMREGRQLTGRQLDAAERILFAAPLPPTVSYASILRLLRDVTGVRYPKFRFTVDGEDLTVVYKSRKGTADVTTVRKSWNERFGREMPDWFGRVETDGTLTKGGRITAAIVAALNEIATDPVAAAKKYAGVSGNCSFCGREIETAESLAVGYGPVCADNWGLPWGDR